MAKYDEKFLEMMLKKAQEKDAEPEPYQPAEVNTKEIEEYAEKLKKELANKRK